jgi:Zn-dependent membrane protease YugP
MLYFDPLFLVVMLPGLALSLWASFRVKTTFKRYSEVRSQSGMTGAEAANAVLRRKGVKGVSIEPTQGILSDHYDPGERVLRLSEEVYHGTSLAALGVAAHEAGHAIQHAAGYQPMKFRSAVVKPAAIGSNLGMILAGIGVMVHASGMIWLGIVLFSAFVLFTLATLPVEFNASTRAIAALREAGIIAPQEVEGTSAVLRAAALTYVAAAISAITQLLYLLWQAGLLGSRGSEE